MIRPSPRARSAAARLWLASVVALVAALGCSRCEKKPAAAATVTRYVPATVEAAVVVPDLGALGDRLVLLQSLKIANFAAQLQGLPDAKAFGDALVRQAGLDLRSRDALKKAGIDPARGLAAGFLPEGPAFAVVGVADEKALGQTLQQLAKDRLGASEVSRKQVDGRELVTFSRAGKVELGYLVVDGFALVGPGAAAQMLPVFARIPKEGALAEDAAFKAALARLPKERDLIVHAPQTLTASRKPALLAFTGAARLTPEGLFVNVTAPWPETEASLAALERKDGPDLVPLLPSDAFAVVRLLGDPLALEPLWPRLVGPHLHRALTQANVDVKQEILANLEPGAAVSLSVSPSIPLGAGMPEIDVRRTNPFRYAHLVALARAKEPDKVPPLLARLPELAPRFGARIEAVEQQGQRVYVTRYAQGEGVHVAQAADGSLVLASPLARLERELAALAAKDAPPPPLLQEPVLKEALGKGALNVVVDLNQLRDAVRALPPEAWGIGGFAIKGVALRWLDATSDLRAITVNASRKDKTVEADLALRFTKK